MPKRFCNAMGYVIAWALVGSVFQLAFGIVLWNSLFTTLLMLFGLMAIFEGTVSSRLGGTFASSKLVGGMVDVIPSIVIYTVAILIAAYGFGVTMVDVDFLPLLAGVLCASLLAAVSGHALQKLLAPAAK